MPDTVSLNIPVDLRTPGAYLEIDASRAVSGLPTQPRRLLVMGQRLTTGTVAQAVPTRVTSAASAVTYFGRGSMLARQLTALFATVGAACDIYAVALDDAGAGVAATKTITIAGTVTAAGTLALYLGGTRVAVAVAAAQTPTVTAAAIAAAVTAQPDLPVTAAAAVGVVTLTARHKGECGTAFDVRHSYYMGESLPPGLTCVIAAGTAGSGNPVLSTALAALAGTQYQTLVTPWTDSANMVLLEAELDARWGPLETRTGHAFCAVTDTFANLSTWGSARNNAHVSCFGLSSSPTWPPERAAAWAGVIEYYGAIDPARPFTTLPVPGVLAPAETAQFTRAERDLLLRDGISTATIGPDGSVAIERVITTYQTTPGGVETTAFLDLNTVWTVDYIRYAVRARILERYPRHKLADDGTRFAPGQAVATPRLIRGELVALFRDLEQAGLVENFEQFKTELLVVRSTSDPNRINAIIPPNIVNQFLVFAAAIQFRL